MDYKIIAVDFDGTLCYSEWPALGEANKKLIDYLLNEQASGNKLILWTCRAGKALSDAIDWCHDQGLVRTVRLYYEPKTTNTWKLGVT